MHIAYFTANVGMIVGCKITPSLSQVLVQLLMKFQRLYPYFRWCQTQRWYMQHLRELFSAANSRRRPPNHIYFYLSLGMILFDQMLPNQRRVAADVICCLSISQHCMASGYHIRCISICIYVFPVWRPIYWIFRCIPTLTTKTSAPVSRQSPETELWLANYSWLIVYHQKWYEFLFSGRPPSWICSWKQLSAIEQLSRAPHKTWV